MEYPLLRKCTADWQSDVRKMYAELANIDIRSRMIVSPVRVRLVGAKEPMKFRNRSGKWLPYIITHDENDYWKYNVISDYFTESVRVRCHKKGCMSLANYWTQNQDAIVAKVGNDTLACREEIYNQYGQGRKECTLHRPIVTFVIYKYFNARRVLDPCAGWGGRIIASILAGCDYVGVDPNEDLHPCYDEIRSVLGGKSQTICCPFEDFEWDGELFDLAYTSPPYFDLEVYGTSPGQSIIRNPTLDGWISGFLIPLLRNCIRYVKPGGIIAINISGMQYVAPMKKYMSEQGQEYLGTKRSASAVPSQAMPIFVWRTIA